MSRHEATFDVSSRADARAVHLLVERLHDTLREEFQAVRERTSDHSPGSLTVVYESDEEPFEE